MGLFKMTEVAKIGFHRFVDREGNLYGSFEVFYVSYGKGSKYAAANIDSVGWYWWSCQPGCMPDGEPIGPFNTSQEAFDNAQEI